MKSIDDFTKAKEAIRLETEHHNHEKSIKKWAEIFGDEFPTYG